MPRRLVLDIMMCFGVMGGLWWCVCNAPEFSGLLFVVIAVLGCGVAGWCMSRVDDVRVDEPFHDCVKVDEDPGCPVARASREHRFLEL